MGTDRAGLRHIVAITSELARSSIHGQTSLNRTLALASEFDSEFLIAGEKSFVTDFANAIICNVNDPKDFAEAIVDLDLRIHAIAIHDACRPLTRTEQVKNAIAAFSKDVDGVRPTIDFTETLKFVDSNSVIEETLDRSSVRRVSTPEIIRLSAIDIKGEDSGWFVTLTASAKLLDIPGDPEALRINSTDDIALLESFAHWRKSAS
ncbi:MAG: 2-C-methyl-D-erythritol 4-phosphate cytidylyltransferase [Actinobacteria bacterium]|nr:2-C-methyl-D-erythritol 4-phosphate cytidylyltransferase [Actinomycetota bacterium]